MTEYPCSWCHCTRRATVEIGPFEAYCGSHARRTADRETSRKVMERDRRVCQRCGAGATDAMHIVGRGQRYVRYELENLLAGCRPCHVFLDEHPAQKLAWVADRWPGRLERMWAKEAQGELHGASVDLAAVIRGLRDGLTGAEAAAYESGEWL